MPNIVKEQTPSKTEQKVIDYLASQFNFASNIAYGGEGISDQWAHDKWLITISKSKTITSGGIKQNKVTEQFEYKTGFGHRYLQPFAVTEVKRYKLKPGTLAYSSATSNSYYIKQPQIAAVLYCLLSDAAACNESFSNWCENFGYDSDSISAFNTYQSCEKTNKQLNNLFNREQLQTLRDLLQDY